MTKAKKLASALSDGYTELNATEKFIVDSWVEKGGLTRERAMQRLRNDLADAAEEDGYDGP